MNVQIYRSMMQNILELTFLNLIKSETQAKYLKRLTIDKTVIISFVKTIHTTLNRNCLDFLIITHKPALSEPRIMKTNLFSLKIYYKRSRAHYRYHFFRYFLVSIRFLSRVQTRVSD
jgi:hypothetical protein